MPGGTSCSRVPRKPELTEAQTTLAKKRQELARVLERLRSPQLSHGIAASYENSGPFWSGKLLNWSRPEPVFNGAASSRSVRSSGST